MIRGLGHLTPAFFSEVGLETELMIEHAYEMKSP